MPNLVQCFFWQNVSMNINHYHNTTKCQKSSLTWFILYTLWSYQESMLCFMVFLWQWINTNILSSWIYCHLLYLPSTCLKIFDWSDDMSIGNQYKGSKLSSYYLFRILRVTKPIQLIWYCLIVNHISSRLDSCLHAEHATSLAIVWNLFKIWRNETLS